MSDAELFERFPKMTPIKGPPGLWRINGCGVSIYGKRDADSETGTYVTTWCLCLLFIPVLCLRAYRVARARQGWYFIGREPLSALARGLNVAVLGSILGMVGVVQYQNYISTPDYKAKKQMAVAREQVAGGQLAQAARIYQTLAGGETEQAGNAATALRDLLDNQCRQAALTESATVYGSAVQVARRGQSLTTTEVADKGMKLVADKGDADPRGGIAVLDIVRPLVIDTRPLDARRLTLLRKWVTLEPTNLNAVTPLAALLEQQDQLDEARKILMPVKDKLGDGEGARVLGLILGREGDFDGSYTLLWPYVKSRLDRLHDAEKAASDTVQQLWDAQIKVLEENNAPQTFYDKYNNAGKDEQRSMVREYVNNRIKNDPTYTSTQDALEHEAAVVPVALELGIVMLQRAQGQIDVAARKSQLESAEKVFLAVSGVAGETDEYRLSLGQVYYWLGKQKEGHKLFDDFLTAKGRAFRELMMIAHRLRQLGANPEARTLAEEAYAKTNKTEDQHAAAGFRSVVSKDLDDEIVWLNKADSADPNVKASLAKSQGDKAFAEGRDDEAGKQYQAAITVYAGMPRSSTSLNQTALAYYAYFQVTGDHAALQKCIDYFQQAVELDPTDTILLFNAGATLLNGALADVIGNQIDLRALHQSGGIGWMGYLYNDQAGRDALVKKVKDHPGVARGLGYLDKVMVLSPKTSMAFATAFGVYRFTRDEAALKTLEQRLKAADLDTSDELAEFKQALTGEKDSQNQATLTASIKRSEEKVNSLRAKGGVTLAIALCHQAELMLSIESSGGTVDADKIVALTEEANRLAPSSTAGAVMQGAYLHRAGRDLRRAEPQFEALYQKYRRSLGMTMLIAHEAAGPGPLQQKITDNADVKKVAALLRDEPARFPDGGSSYDWALLKTTFPAEAERMAASIRKSPRNLIAQSISTMLNPASAAEALQESWLMQINGQPEAARAAIAKVAAMGIPVPLP